MPLVSTCTLTHTWFYFNLFPYGSSINIQVSPSLNKYTRHILDITFTHPIFSSVMPVVYLGTKQTNTHRKGSQKHNYNCNIQGVSVYTNVSANYMFRPLLVKSSSGWIPQSEEMYNSVTEPLKSGAGGRDLVYKNGACAQTSGIKICIVYISLWYHICPLLPIMVRVSLLSYTSI